MVEDWAVYGLPAPLMLKMPKGRFEAHPGDDVCGSCISHLRKLRLISAGDYKAIAKNVRNVAEKQRTAKEFE